MKEMYTRTEHRRFRRFWVVWFSVLAVLVTGCSAGGGTEALGAVGVEDATPDEITEAEEERPDVLDATAKPVPDPVLEEYTPVLRRGKPPRPTVTAPPASFREPLTYTDGLTLEVVSAEHGREEGRGPGVLVGQPTTSIELRMTNGGRETVSLDGVVVTMVYGEPRQQARPVYDDMTTRDFVGELGAGKSMTAVYVFSVPREQLDDLTMYVDFDAVHTVAEFHGSLQ